jgi:hypothetical protein
MTRFRLVLGRDSGHSYSGPSSLFDSTDLGRTYFPGRGILYSVCIHIVVFVGVFFLSLFRSIPDPPLLVNQISFVYPRLPKVLMYLPVLEPAGKFMRFPEAKAKAGPKRATQARSVNTKGLSYPGPQRIVSDPPNPTNLIQTVLQPDLEKPPILVPPLPLPNIVQLADVSAALPKIPVPQLEPPKADLPDEPKPVKEPEVAPEVNEPEPAMVLPALELAPPTRMEAPKLILPPSTPPVLTAKPADRPVKMELPNQMKAAAPPPEPEPAPESKTEPPPQKMAESPKPEPAPKTSAKSKSIPGVESSAATKGKKNLLSLTPMPASPKDPVKVPAGEARGRFVISPEPNLAASEKDPGMKTGSRSQTIAIAKTPAISSKEESVLNASAGGGQGDGSKTTNGKGSSIGLGGGTEAGQGSKPGSSSGLGSSSGSGAAQGAGKKPFAGITIIGGESEPGENSNDAPVARPRRPLQTAYGLSIISTENSGGGLPFVGVFSNEQIYTVYLDMRQSETEEDPTWTLEFAIIPGSGNQSSNPGSFSRNQQGLILPFPAEKTRPVLPVELVRRHLNKMVIAYGIIGTNGKMEQITIEQSPDNQLDEPVFQALEKWVFRPAQLNGEPVAAKVLMGIPLWLPE